MLLSRSSAPLGVAVAALLAAAVAPAAHAAVAVAVSPLDGTPDANPATQISVLGVAPSRIAAVRAVGARSGAHSGKLKDYSGGRGASFVPARPFAAGERVAVTVRLRGVARARQVVVHGRHARADPAGPEPAEHAAGQVGALHHAAGPPGAEDHGRPGPVELVAR